MIQSNENVLQSRADFMEQGMTMINILEGIAKAERFNKEQNSIIEFETDNSVLEYQDMARRDDEFLIGGVVADNTEQTVNEMSERLFGVVKRKFFKLFGR
jgi:hypothetical protein